jgi:hypothetical protein
LRLSAAADEFEMRRTTQQQGTEHDFLACRSTGNAAYLAYAISFGPSHHHKAKTSVLPTEPLMDNPHSPAGSIRRKCCA